ncbi:MAG: hypothetical protein ACLPSH_11020 [Vulcanimicrobiaceae bacterium]
MNARARLGRALTAAAIVVSLLDPLVTGASATAAQAPATDAPAALVTPAAVPVSAPSSAPKYADLSHLVYSATSDLHATLVFPQPGSAAISQAVAMDITVGLGQGAEVRVNGSIVPPTRIGKRVVDLAQGIVRYTFYGVILEPGPNRISVTPLGAAGMRGPRTDATVYGPGKPSSLKISFHGRPVADGKSPVSVLIEATDAWGHPALPGSTIKLTVNSGDARLDVAQKAVAAEATASSAPSAPPSAPAATSGSNSVSVALDPGGTATAVLLPGLRPGDVALTFGCDDLAVQRRVFFAPYVRPPLVVGLATVGVGAVPGIPGEADGAVDGADSRRGRVALYATGGVGSKGALTVAYDTASTLAQTTSNGAFVDDPNARPYSTYGDASVRGDDAVSQDHLYARFDEGRSQALWGQFSARTGTPGGLGFTNLLVNGASLTLGSPATQLSLFHAQDQTAYARQIFSPSGLAVVGSLAHDTIVVGSDVVLLLALDRRTGAVLSQTQLVRNIDYTLDYATGAIRFINVPMPYDAAFNPQQVLVEYEYQGSGLTAEISGGRAETSLGNGSVHAGVGYLNDAYGSGNASVFSQYLHGDVSGGSWSLEHASSSGDLQTTVGSQVLGSPSYGTSGQAFGASYNRADATSHLALSFSSASPGYDNPFGGLSVPGLTQYTADYAHKLDRRGSELDLNYDHEQNTIPDAGGSASNASVRLHEVVSKRLSLTAGIVERSQTTETSVAPSPAPSASAAATTYEPVSGSTTQIDVGADYKVAPRVDLALDRTSNLGGSSAVAAGQTSAQLNVDMNGGRAYVRQLWSDAPVASFASATQPLTTAALATHATSFGFERTVGMATFSSDYSVAQTGNGIDITSALGGDQRFTLGKALRGDVLYQRGSDVGSAANGTGFNVYRTALTYAQPNGRLRASGSYELRTGSSPGSTLLLGAAGALSPTLSLVGSVDSDHTQLTNTDVMKVGLAYRPVLNDRGVTLLDYERNDGQSTTGAKTDTISLEHLMRPTTRLEVAGRYAYKLDGDGYYAARSSLLGVRVTQRVGSRFDIGGESSTLGVHGIGSSVFAGAVEAGLRLGDSLRVGLGYNLTQSPDPALANAPTHRGFYATFTTVVDNILGWGSNR